jgi:hypothetical protein
MYKDSLSTTCSLQLFKLSLLAVYHCGYPSFKWEEGVKECAARIIWCHNWQLTAQNRTVWWQKLSEARAVVLYDGWMDGWIQMLSFWCHKELHQ